MDTNMIMGGTKTVADEARVTILCSNFDRLHNMACDLPLHHKGPHRGSVYWGDEHMKEE